MANELILLFAIGLCSCESPEIPEPAKTASHVRSYTIQPQQNGVTIFPKYIPILKYNGK